MAKKVAPNEITSWLILDNYEPFLALSIEDILMEIELRVMFLIEYAADSEESLDKWHEIESLMLSEIKKGLVFSSDISKLAFEQYFDNDPLDNEKLKEPREFLINGYPVISNEHELRAKEEELSEGDAISPFSLADLATYYRFYERFKYIDHGSRLSSINKGRIFSSVSAVEERSDNFSECVVMKVDIGSYSDDELLAEFKELLKEWRYELDVEEPEATRVRVGLSTLKKIYTYKIFPFLDLLLWEKVNGRKISNELVARVLFPLGSHDVIGGQQIKDTIRPFVERIVNGYTHQQIKFYVKKNDYLKDMRLSEVLKLAED
ncbi:DUF6387 family protein [Yersinia bercovieri]|uniref:DUF6387 family protein n=1 Tax=Yersinia bercovieri TaxID=634 RepID=UPI0030D2C244